MSYVYGNVRMTLTGSEETLRKGLEILKTVQLESMAERYLSGFVGDYERYLGGMTLIEKGKNRGMYKMIATDDFWDVASIPYEAIKEVKKQLPELGVRINFKVADSITDSYVRFTCESLPGQAGWMSGSLRWTMSMIDMMMN